MAGRDNIEQITVLIKMVDETTAGIKQAKANIQSYSEIIKGLNASLKSLKTSMENAVTLDRRDSIRATIKATQDQLQSTNLLKKNEIDNLSVLKEKMSVTKENLSMARKGVDVDLLQSNSAMGFGQVMAMNLDTLRAYKDTGLKNITTNGKLAFTFRNLTSGMQGFKMEMLSVMFFGMGIQRFFQGLLQPALEATGIFDLLSVTLQLVFLPIVLALLPYLIGLMTWFMDLPEPIKMAIGVISLFGIVLGTLLFLIGTVTLGLGGLSMAFGGIFSAGAGLAIIGGIFTTVLGIIGQIIALLLTPIIAAGLILLAIGIMNNWEGVQRALGTIFEGISKAFEAAIAIMQGVWDLFMGIIEADPEKISKALYDIFYNIGKFVIEGIGKFMEGVISLFIAIEYGIGKWVVTWLGHIYKFIDDVTGGALSAGVKFVANLIAGIVSQAGAFAQALFNIIPEPFRSLIRGGINIATGAAGATQGAIRGLAGFQHGGIVTRPTIAMLGESGPEAITPLGASMGGSDITININVDAKTAEGVNGDDIARIVNENLVNELKRLSLA